MDIDGFFAGIAKIFEIVASSSATATLSSVGLLLLVLAGSLAYQAMTKKPDDLPKYFGIALFTSLLGGMIFSAAGPSLALFWVSQIPIKRVSADLALDNLEQNKQVKWVVRLISFNQALEPDRGIDRLQRLGPPKQLFSFVASYEELAGYTVKDALEMIGGKYTPGDRVSAVIFPLRTPLFPANARGLLQVIQDVEGRKDTEIKEKFLHGNNTLNGDELKNLKADDIPSYRVANFKDKYQHFCELTYKFICDETSYSARDYVGGLYKDWHPLGFSQRKPPEDRCSTPKEKYCAFSDWKTTKATFNGLFGSRAFLIRNMEINLIPGRILIDFENPTEQLIPDIGTR